MSFPSLSDARLAPEAYQQLKNLHGRAKQLKTDVRSLKRTQLENSIIVKDMVTDALNKIT